VRDYDDALSFFVEKLGFSLIEDTHVKEQNKRWVIVKPSGSGGACLLLAQASTADQIAAIGKQTGGRIFLFLYIDDFCNDYERHRTKGVEFMRPPREQADRQLQCSKTYKDLYDNAWGLKQSNQSNMRWQP